MGVFRNISESYIEMSEAYEIVSKEIPEEFSGTVCLVRPWLGDGCQVIWWFPNEYGVSLVYGKYSYGIECCVIKFKSLTDWQLIDEPIGYMDKMEIRDLLNKVKNFKCLK